MWTWNYEKVRIQNFLFFQNYEFLFLQLCICILTIHFFFSELQEKSQNCAIEITFCEMKSIEYGWFNANV